MDGWSLIANYPVIQAIFERDPKWRDGYWICAKADPNLTQGLFLRYFEELAGCTYEVAHTCWIESLIDLDPGLLINFFKTHNFEDQKRFMIVGTSPKINAFYNRYLCPEVIGMNCLGSKYSSIDVLLQFEFPNLEYLSTSVQQTISSLPLLQLDNLTVVVTIISNTIFLKFLLCQKLQKIRSTGTVLKNLLLQPKIYTLSLELCHIEAYLQDIIAPSLRELALLSGDYTFFNFDQLKEIQYLSLPNESMIHIVPSCTSLTQLDAPANCEAYIDSLNYLESLKLTTDSPKWKTPIKSLNRLSVHSFPLNQVTELFPLLLSLTFTGQVEDSAVLYAMSNFHEIHQTGSCTVESPPTPSLFLKKLTINSYKMNSAKLCQLIRRCPNLESIQVPPTVDPTDLGHSLSKCQKLKSLRVFSCEYLYF